MDVQVNEFVYEFPDDLSDGLTEILNAIAPRDRNCRHLPLGDWLVRFGQTTALIHTRFRFSDIVSVGPDKFPELSRSHPASKSTRR
jgi:hypothetical protein